MRSPRPRALMAFLAATVATPLAAQTTEGLLLAPTDCLGIDVPVCSARAAAAMELAWHEGLTDLPAQSEVLTIQIPERVAPVYPSELGGLQACPELPCNRAPDHVTADVGNESGITAFLASAPLVTVLVLATQFIAGAELDPYSFAPFPGGENADKRLPPKKPMERR